MDSTYYPDWLYRDLVENELPWNSATAFAFEDFLLTYTLHDSSWVGVFSNCRLDDAVTLCIVWDRVWLPEELKRELSGIPHWPFLFVRIEGVTRLSFKSYDDIGLVGRTIADCEVSSVEHGRLVTVADIFGGRVEFEFVGLTRFLGFSHDKQLLPI